MKNLNQRSSRIQKKAEGFGFDPASITLIVGVISAIASLFKDCGKEDEEDPVDPVQASKNAQRYVTNRFNSKRGRYAPGLMKQVSKKVRAQAKKENKALTNSQVEKLAFEVLEDLRTNEPTPEEYEFSISPEGQGFAAKDEEAE